MFCVVTEAECEEINGPRLPTSDLPDRGRCRMARSQGTNSLPGISTEKGLESARQVISLRYRGSWDATAAVLYSRKNRPEDKARRSRGGRWSTTARCDPGVHLGDVFILPVHHGGDRRAKLTWNDLNEDAQREFLSYPLSVNVLENISDADVLQVFSRINSYSLPLNRQELLNAEYVGEFKQAIDMLSREHLAYWRMNEILTDQQIARMKDLELTVELIAQMMLGLQNQRRIIPEVYKRYDDPFPQIDYLAPRFADTLEHSSMLCQNEIAETIFRSPPVFYSLFGAIYDVRYGFESGQDVNPKRIIPGRAADVTAGLLELSAAVQEEAPQAAEFAKAARYSTDKIEQRRVRRRI